MRVLIKPSTNPAVSIVDSDDTKHLSVATTVDDSAEIESALNRSGAGTLDNDHAWLSIDFLRQHASPVNPAAWSSGFDAMIQYARDCGWVSEDGRSVRAHVETCDRVRP